MTSPTLNHLNHLGQPQTNQTHISNAATASSLAEQLKPGGCVLLRIQQPGLVLSCADVGLEWQNGVPEEGEGGPSPCNRSSSSTSSGTAGTADRGFSCGSAGREGRRHKGGMSQEQQLRLSCYQLHVLDMQAPDNAAAAAADNAAAAADNAAAAAGGDAAPATKADASAGSQRRHTGRRASQAVPLAHEFAAIPSQLPQHSAQHSRPVPLWPPPPPPDCAYAQGATASASSTSTGPTLDASPPTSTGYGYSGVQGETPSPCFWTHPSCLQVST